MSYNTHRLDQSMTTFRVLSLISTRGSLTSSCPGFVVVHRACLTLSIVLKLILEAIMRSYHVVKVGGEDQISGQQCYIP
jgi:hypothetical protein